jgi:hypothetical protein
MTFVDRPFPDSAAAAAASAVQLVTARHGDVTFAVDGWRTRCDVVWPEGRPSYPVQTLDHVAVDRWSPLVATSGRGSAEGDKS